MNNDIRSSRPWRASKRVVSASLAALAMSVPLAGLIPGSIASAASGTWTDLTGNGIFAKPMAVTVDDAGDVFVLNDTSGTNVVEELPHGSSTWIDITNGYPFNVSYGGRIAVNSQGDLFVTNFKGSQVDELIPVGGNYQSTSWKDISAGGPVYAPFGIAVDSSGNVWVANNVNYGAPIISEWSPGTNTWMAKTNYSGINWPQALAVDSAGDAFLSYAFATGVYELPNGSTTLAHIPSPFAGGAGSSVGPNGNLYVASGNVIWELSPDAGNNYVHGTWTAISSSVFNGPTDVAFDSAGDMFVTNSNNTTTNAVVEFRVSQPPPTPIAETVNVDGSVYQVIGNFGYNPAAAIQQGSYAGYIEERAAIEAGASFSGQGTESSYLSAILDGSGVGIDDTHVTPEQQGQFAALYQKLGIIPTWTNNTVQIAAGVTALKAGAASALAIENYLVQMDGYSWSTAEAQAAAGFPVQSGT